MSGLLVTGGTGQLGGRFVPLLSGAGLDPMLLGRGPGCALKADLSRPEDVRSHAAALRGVRTLVHAAHPMRAPAPEAPDAAALFAESADAFSRLLGLLPALHRLVLVSSTAAERPADLYGVSKALDEDLARLWCEDRRVELCVLRVSSVYGPGARVTRSLERFLREALAGRRPAVRGGGGPGTDYLHVDDAARAVVSAVSSGATGVMHVSSGRAVTPEEGAREAMRVAGLPGEPEILPGPQAGGSGPVDNSDAARALGWRPELDLGEGLKEFARWIRRRSS